ncbi:MAG: hypothetical protein U9O98_01390 [Asgard group archaeon]|nr:hypothetical protein [Asgard group archaeon]
MSLNRLFFFQVPSLSYSKKDLNDPSAQQRAIIGELATAVTNAVFLSHALRENIGVYVYTTNPTPHLLYFTTNSIRYLGPQARSFASLVLKAQRVLADKCTQSLNPPSKPFSANPGLFISCTHTPFTDIIAELPASPKILYFQDSFATAFKKSNHKYFPSTLKKFEEYFYDSTSSSLPVIFPFLLPFNNPRQLKPRFSLENHSHLSTTYLKLPKKYTFPQLITVLNFLLDKKIT